MRTMAESAVRSVLSRTAASSAAFGVRLLSRIAPRGAEEKRVAFERLRTSVSARPPMIRLGTFPIAMGISPQPANHLTRKYRMCRM